MDSSRPRQPGPTSRPAAVSGRIRTLAPAAVGWRWRHPRVGGRTELHLVEQGRARDFFFSVLVGKEVAAVAHDSPRLAAGAKPLWRHETRCGKVLGSGRARLDGAMWLEPLGSTTLHLACFPVKGQGYQVHALDARTGKVHWMVEPRPLRSSPDAAQAIQLGIDSARAGQAQVVVYRNSRSEPFVDVLDLSSGKPVASAGVPPKLTTLPWRDLPRTERWPSLASNGARFLVQGGSRETITVRRLDRGGKQSWSARLTRISCGDRAALAILDQRLFVASYCGSATGTEVTALDARAGSELWKAVPYGVGPIGHSKYSNAVALATAHGHLVVFGDESGGRYIETFAPDTGRPVAAQRLR